MSRLQVAAVIIGFVIIALTVASIKHAQCEYMSPDHVTYCMLMTK